MPFLIAKVLVLLLAAAFGAWLGAWFLRRRYVIPPPSTRCCARWRAWLGQLDERLAADTRGPALLRQRLAALETGVRGIQVPPHRADRPGAGAAGHRRHSHSAPERVDFAPVLQAIDAIRIPAPERANLEPVLQAVGAIRIPPAERVDLAPVIERIAAVEQKFAALRIPEPPPPAPVDLAPLQSALEARIAALDARLASLHIPEPAPPADLKPLHAALEAVQQRVAGIVLPAPPTEVDLGPLALRLASLEETVRGWKPPPVPEPPPPADLRPVLAAVGTLGERIATWRMPEVPRVDLEPVRQRLQALEGAVAAIRIPEPPPAPPLPTFPPIPAPPDLAPLQRQLDAVAQAVAGLPRALPAPAVVDLGPLSERVGRIEQALRAIVVPAAPDLGPLHERLGSLAQQVAAIRIPPPAAAPVPAPAVDLTPVLRRLDAIEAQLRQRAAAPPAMAALPAAALPAASAGSVAPVASKPPPAAAPRNVRAGSRNLLTHAAHGKPDDLQRIKGVATVLEKMLHGIGVYYFWQIADWDAADIEHADRLLTAFKGRIRRDAWVAQARRFVREGGVAVKPAAA
ncbi:MAG: hypothetical protein U1F49_16010 [Rubrivivax sp.]